MTTSNKQRDALFAAEHHRQTAAFSLAIDVALNAAASEFECPLINSVAAAIVMAEAQLLASVPDPDARKAIHDAMNNFRPTAYEKCAATMKIELVVTQKKGALQ